MATKLLKKPDSFYNIYERKSGIQDVTHYCPGCTHGSLHKMIAEALVDLGIQDRTVFISPVGCSVFGYYYFKTGNIQAAHGRAPAVATGIKRVHPHSIVISYQGDGDLAAIGGNNILQAANRGENITVFFVNNGIYGMTGGQMAPTTLLGGKTTTSPEGRAVTNEGPPIKISEMLATLEAPVYIERVALTDAKNLMKARKAVRKALQNQIDNKGFSLVELLSTCPSMWKMEAPKAKEWLTENMVPYFPLGVYRDKTGEIEPQEIVKPNHFPDDIFARLDIQTEDFAENKVDELIAARIKMAGFGGQGILLMGLTMAEAGMEAGYHVTWLPSYGPEMRGGTANCHVNLSTERIGSPMVSRPTILFAMNKPSLQKFEDEVAPGGVILYDSSLIDEAPKRTDIQAYAVPATQMADEMGNTRIANMVMFGAFVQQCRVITKEIVFQALPHIISRKNLIPLNEQAIEKGMEFVKENY